MMPSDPFTYIARATRDESGKVRTLELIYPEEVVQLSEGDEFVTFATVMDLEVR